ncbi:MAG TPA: sigma factor, partial [Puia sp.]|nr:sigma factor [Puia sp.]
MKRSGQPYQAYSDEELLALIHVSDMAAFSVLYDRYWDRIFYIAAGKLNDHVLAEDVVQDIFTDLWRRRADLHIEGSTAAYLAVAVKYRIINIQARQQRVERYKKDMATPEATTGQDIEDLLSFKELYQ